MKSYKLLFMIGLCVFSFDATVQAADRLDPIDEQLRRLPFDRNSETVKKARDSLVGMQILHANHTDFREAYIGGDVNKEELYGVFLELESFLDVGGSRFSQDSLFLKNYKFLQGIFFRVSLI
jgi:hypothetical protein